MTKEIEFFTFLSEKCAYLDVRKISDHKWAAIFPFAYTCAIITGTIGDFTGYDDRWCYADYEKASAALKAWNGSGEPEGWHRHPDSGRRVMEDGTTVVYF